MHTKYSCFFVCLLQDLAAEQWYHGVLPRDDIQRRLVNEGDFLVRLSRSRRTGLDQYVLSVRCATSPKHFIIQHTPEVLCLSVCPSVCLSVTS